MGKEIGSNEEMKKNWREDGWVRRICGSFSVVDVVKGEEDGMTKMVDGAHMNGKR